MARYDSRHNRRGTRPARGTAARRDSSYDEEIRRRERRARRSGSFSPSVARHPLPIVLCALFGVVVLRLVLLQVVDAPWLSAKADAIHTQTLDLYARRGTIYDRNGNVLAMSVECRTLYAVPEAVNDKNGAAQILADSLGGDAADYLEAMNVQASFSYLKRQIDTDRSEEVLAKLKDAGIEGILELRDTKRTYPYGAVAGQVLGFVGTDGHGLSGLELQYDDILSGTDGKTTVELGADGTPVAGGTYDVQEARDGTDIVISLDVNVQSVAEEQLTRTVADSEAESGTAIVTDPSTGEVLAMCSTPLFDPTSLDALTNESLKFRGVSDSYEPGSIMKVLTMAIGYDSGAISDSSTFTVPASIKVGDDKVTDDDGRDYTMDMDVREIMRRSSNVGAAMVGNAIGADAFSAGLERFGIGQATGIDYPGEVTGMVTQRADYTGATLGAMSFGQAVAFPMMQIVRAVGAVANEGVLTVPHLLIQKGGQTMKWDSTSQAISAEAAHAVTDDMVTVVEEGTGTKAQVEGYTVAGKTGTGQQASDEGGYKEDSFVSSFIGFANADDPHVLVYVGLNGTAQHGGTAAAPAFSAIMGEALADMGVQPAK